MPAGACRLYAGGETGYLARVWPQQGHIFVKAEILLLIENKLDTSEQPRQAESYRAEALEQAAQYDVVRTILVCPQDYRAANVLFAGAFDHVITYDYLAKFFEARALRETGELWFVSHHDAVRSWAARVPHQ